MKKITLRREVAYLIQRKLKDIPPRLMPSTQEIIVTGTKIVPVLEVQTSEYNKMMDKRDQLIKKLNDKKIKQDEFDKALAELSEDFNAYNEKHKDDEVIVELEDEAFNIFREQFQRQDKELGKNDVWGRSWVPTTAAYIKLDEAFKQAEEGK